MEKKERRTNEELNSLTFQTHLSFTLYTHTHTAKKHFKSCPNLCKLLAECVFLFVFFSLRIVTLTGTRRAILFLEKMGIIIAACVGDDCIKIDRFKKKRNLNPHSTTLYLSKTRSKPTETHSSMCFSHVSCGFTRNTISRDAIRARKRRDRSQASFFCFSRMQSSSAFGGTFGHVLGQKKKKRTDPFTSSFSHTKNIIYNE